MMPGGSPMAAVPMDGLEALYSRTMNQAEADAAIAAAKANVNSRTGMGSVVIL